MLKKLNMIFVIFLCLILPISAFAQSYANTGPTTENTGDVGVPSGSSYYINDVKQVLINKWDATSPPDVDDDITGGYTPGSIWVDITGDNSYMCVDNTDGVALWVAMESSVYVRAGEAIKKGQAVYISGALGAARPTVSLADADDSAKIRILGLAAQDIASGSDGIIRISGGQIKGVDTEGVTDVNPGDEDWTAGDRLFVMLDGSGALTNVRPTSGRVIIAGYTQLGDHNSDTLFVATHVNPADLSTAVDENIRFRLGAADGSTSITIKDYADAEVANIDDNGDADFNSLILDTVLAVAEGGTGAGDLDALAKVGANSDITSLTGLTTPLAANYGGTGVANNAASTLTISGNFATTLTVTEATSVTLPASGTLAVNNQTMYIGTTGVAINRASAALTLAGITLTTPNIGAATMGGNITGGDYYITGLGRVSFTQELDNGSKTANFSIDFATDQKQKVTLTANTMTLTLDTTTVGVGNYLLKMVNGGLATLTWASESGSVYFPGGTDPVLTASGTDIVTFYFDGTDWYGMAGLDFK